MAALWPGAAGAEKWLAWTAPPECPNEADMEERVEELLGMGQRPAGRANVVVARHDGAYRADLAVHADAGSGHRVLADARCRDLADAVALVLVLGMPVSGDRSTAAFRFQLAARVGALHGPLPRTSAGLGLSLAAHGPVEVELHGAYFAPQTRALGDGVLSARLRLAGAGIRLGVPLRWESLELVPRVGVDVYLLVARGQGGAVSRTASNAMFGPAAGMLLRLRLDEHWALSLSLDGVSPLLRRAPVVFTDAGRLYRPAVVAMQAFGAVEVHL